MKNLDRKQKLCVAGWLLAAAILLWVNASFVFSLEEAPVTGDPTILRALRSKLARLESLAALERFAMDEQSARTLFAAYRRPKDSSSASQADANTDALARGGIDAEALPGLAGVMQVLDQRGIPYYMAILDGRVCHEQDRVKTFTVGAITAEGVVLQRSGHRWFVPSPRPYYTSDQGR